MNSLSQIKVQKKKKRHKENKQTQSFILCLSNTFGDEYL